MAVTRIKNNQITDATIFANVKIAPGTIVGTLFNPDVTINSNISIIGNLSVTGTTITINSTNTLVNDPLVIFNSGYVGTPSYDVGVLVNRNLQPVSPTNYGGLNSAWVWREADGAFESILTTETGTTQGAINRTAYANVVVGNTIIRTTATNPSVVEAVDTSTGALQVKGGASVTQSLQVGGAFSSFGANTGQVQMSGNVPVVQIQQIGTTRPGLMLTGNSGDPAFAFYTGIFGASIQTYGGTNNDIYIQPANQPSLILQASNGAVIATAGINSTNANVGSIVISGSGGLGVGGNINAGTSATFEGQHITLQSSKQNDISIGKNILKTGLGANTLVIGTMLGTTAVGTNSTLVGAAGPVNAGVNTTTFGKSAGNISTGQNNAFFGYNSGSLVTSGAYNTIFGSHDGNTIATLSNYSIISDGAGNPRINIDNTGNVWIVSAVESTTVTTGALTTPGGVGITKSLNVGQYANIGTAQSPGTTSLRVFGDTFMTGNLTVASNIFVLGSTSFINANTLTVEDSTLALHFFGNMQALNFDDGKDIGVLGNYYKAAAQKSFFGWQNSTSNFVYIDQATESAGNVVSGTYGNVQFGSLWLSNTTPSGSQVTGALVVKGGIGAGALSYLNSVVVDNNLTTLWANVSANLNLTSFTANSALFMSPIVGNSSVDQQWGQFNYQRNTGNTFAGISLSVGTNGDVYSGTDTFNTYYQQDSYLPYSLIAANTLGQSAGHTVSTSRGTGPAPQINQDGDFIGSFGAYNYSGSTAAYQEAGAWRYVTQGSTAAVSGIGGQAQLWTKKDNAASTLALRVDANQVATFYGQVIVANTTGISTVNNSTDGALYVQGSTGIGGNLIVAQSVRLNDTRVANRDFYVRGDKDATLIWASTGTYNQVIIGNSATAITQVTGAKLMINSTDSMIVPVGTTSQRPGDVSGYGSATAGMLRFNNITSDMEYYDGTKWYSPQISQTTAVVSDEFNGDATTVLFTLTRAATTNSVFVAINGILQDPSYAYSVTGTALTFTEAPALGDVINVRSVALTSTVRALASQNGNITISADNYGTLITGNVTTNGGSASANVVAFLPDGTVGYRGTANVNVGLSPTLIHTFRADFYRNAKYVINVQNFLGSSYEVSEVMVIHNGTTASRTQYNRISTLSNGAALGSVTVTYTNTGSYGNVNVFYTGASTNNWVSVRADMMSINQPYIYY